MQIVENMQEAKDAETLKQAKLDNMLVASHACPCEKHGTSSLQPLTDSIPKIIHAYLLMKDMLETCTDLCLQIPQVYIP